MRLRKKNLVFLFFIVFIFTFFLKKSIKYFQSIREIGKPLNEIKQYLDNENYRKFLKFNGLKYSLNFLKTYKDMPYIYVVTPTFNRPNQIAELTRLLNTLRSVPKIIWMIIEDSETLSPNIQKFLEGCKVEFIHLHVGIDEVITFETLKENMDDLNKTGYSLHRGSSQRNTALGWIRKNPNLIRQKSVIYFADDDNSYDIKLFEEMRYTQKVSIWPVGFVGRLLYEKPICEDGIVVDWFFYFNKNRKFPTDMASFAINSNFFLYKNKQIKIAFPYVSKRNYESLFLSDLVSVEELEGKADNCNRAQHLIKIIIMGSQVIGRAFVKALRNEFQHARVAQEARNTSNETIQANRITGMSLEEAKQILDLKDLNNYSEIEERFKKMFEMNDKTKGGSFYLQSKIYRAKERIDEEIKQKSTKQQ